MDLAAINIKSSLENIDEPWKIVVGFILVLIITYAGKFGDILDNYKLSLRSLGGRLIGVVGILLLINQVGWVYGLLGSVALLLVMRGYTDEAEDHRLPIERKAEA